MSKLLTNELGPYAGSEIAIEAGAVLTGTAAQFKVTGGSAGQALTTDGSGVLSFASAGGFVRAVYQDTADTSDSTSSTSYVASSCGVTFTPTAADSSYLVMAYGTMSANNHDTQGDVNFSDSQLGASTGVIPESTNGTGSDRKSAVLAMPSFNSLSGNADDYGVYNWSFQYLYNPTTDSGAQKTFTIIYRGNGSGSVYMNEGSPIQSGTASKGWGRTIITVMEVQP